MVAWSTAAVLWAAAPSHWSFLTSSKSSKLKVLSQHFMLLMRYCKCFGTKLFLLTRSAHECSCPTHQRLLHMCQLFKLVSCGLKCLFINPIPHWQRIVQPIFDLLAMEWMQFCVRLHRRNSSLIGSNGNKWGAKQKSSANYEGRYASI